ncbi:MAG: hypothetical protein JW801_08770 [Bacteroidales bacterium]|nr:hypothetical protein [Bacteroidales bacterium]
MLNSLAFTQSDEIWLDSGFAGEDTIPVLISGQRVNDYLIAIPRGSDQIVIGGCIGSIFHEVIDSAVVEVVIDGREPFHVLSENGLFNFVTEAKGNVVDIFISHPDYHTLDTSIVFPQDANTKLRLLLTPKYRILLRGRVFAGNMPLEGVNVSISHLGKEYATQTLGCYYDSEQYWNCLFDGMFKTELTADTPDDSIYLKLSMDGMQSYTYGMKFQDYTGEIMEFRMKYESVLPAPPKSNINLKLGFPALSLSNDWYMGLSYYRHVGNINRLAYGLDVNMYITNFTVPVETFEGLDPREADSSYINAFVGPSLLYYFIKPDTRWFSSYAGCTFSMNLTELAFVPQLFLGSRIFLDLNKALGLEIRYTEFARTVTHYTFNPYGKAYSSEVSEVFTKLHATIGIQVVF